MRRTQIALAVVCGLLIVAGCVGIGEQQNTPTTSESGTSAQETLITENPIGVTGTGEPTAGITIVDSYPGTFTVTVRLASSDEKIINRSYGAKDHGEIELDSGIPSGEVVSVEITSDDETLWEERFGPSKWYRLEILEDGTVVETLIER